MDREQFNRISRALADPRRMEILERIASEAEVGYAALASEDGEVLIQIYAPQHGSAWELRHGDLMHLLAAAMQELAGSMN